MVRCAGYVVQETIGMELVVC